MSVNLFCACSTPAQLRVHSLLTSQHTRQLSMDDYSRLTDWQSEADDVLCVDLTSDGRFAKVSPPGERAAP